MIRKTKIVATIGPASRDVRLLRRMIRAGLDVARVNASHASPDNIRHEVEALREASSKEGKEVAIILDLMGPKLRVGDIKEDFVLLILKETKPTFRPL